MTSSKEYEEKARETVESAFDEYDSNDQMGRDVAKNHLVKAFSKSLQEAVEAERDRVCAILQAAQVPAEPGEEAHVLAERLIESIEAAIRATGKENG